MFGQTLESLLQILKTSLVNGSFPNSLLLETVGAASEGVANSASSKTLIWGWPLQAPPRTWVTGQTHQTHLGGVLKTRMRRATVFPSPDKQPVLSSWSSGCLDSRDSCLQEREVRDKGVCMGMWGAGAGNNLPGVSLCPSLVQAELKVMRKSPVPITMAMPLRSPTSEVRLSCYVNSLKSFTWSTVRPQTP